MNRTSLSTAILLLLLPATVSGQAAFEVYELQCFNDGTLIGVSSDLRLVTLRDGRWQPLSLGATGVLRLWRSPDDRIFAVADGQPWAAIEVPDTGGTGTRWEVPSGIGFMRFTSLNGIDVVTPDRISRLDPGGKLTDLGETPVGGSGQRASSRAPEILVAKGMSVVCTGSSDHPDDSVGGSCQEKNGSYLYRVDFGDGLCCESEAGHFTNPFVCGDVVISSLLRDARHPPARRETTQARALATGALLGRREGAARLGSTCLDGNRALLVGKRDVQIVSVPHLRPLWRRKTAGNIGAVAVCGGTKVALILEGHPYPVDELDLTAPQTSGQDAASATRAAP
jgi:hypothetical protein